MKMTGVRARWLGLGMCLAALTCNPASAQAQQSDADPYPAVWLDSSALTRSRFGQVRFLARDGNQLNAYIYRATAFDPRTSPIWFVMHGAGRTANSYLNAAAPIAERHAALAIAIEFSEAAYPRGDDYTLGVTTSGTPDASALSQGRWRDPHSYTYSEVEHVFEAVRRSLGGQQQRYYIFGHSAGAQFVHRLLTFRPDARVLGAVAANAGWYTLPVSGNESRYTMPYGLRATPLERTEPRSLFTAPLTVLLGAEDTASADEDDLLRDTPEANAQGSTRLQRGRYYFETGRSAAGRIGAPFYWRTATAGHASHNVRQVIGSAAFFLFESGQPCTTTSAGGGAALVINEILADPSDGGSGDANADGARDASADEFVEIVNTGQTPVCMANWTLGDASDPKRHVFPLGAALQPGEAVVVFGGGVPTGPFGGARVQTAGFSGSLNLTNAGDVLSLRDAAGTVAKQVSWGDCAGQPCARDHRAGSLSLNGSLVRSPDLTGAWTVHGTASSSASSPGVRVDRSPFRSSIPRPPTIVQ